MGSASEIALLVLSGLHHTTRLKRAFLILAPVQKDAARSTRWHELRVQARKRNMASVSAPDVEMEPQLKYEALVGDLPSLLSDDSVTCLCVSEKMLLVGTARGHVHVLDYSGNQVRLKFAYACVCGRLGCGASASPRTASAVILPSAVPLSAPQVKAAQVHKGRVTGVSIDAAEEHVASCSEDGTAMVRGGGISDRRAALLWVDAGAVCRLTSRPRRPTSSHS